MSKTTCPRCGHQANGNFCAACGAALAKRHCNECGAPATPGSRFCNSCGTPVAGPGAGAGAANPSAHATQAAAQVVGAPAAAGADSKAPWILSGAMFIALMFVVALPIIRQEQPAAPVPGAAGAGPFGNANAVDLNSMTPREQADALFTRVMTAASAGDSTEVGFFVPMAIQAYENVEPLDPDGLFHVSMLKQTADDLEGALEATVRGLEARPNHLLLLYAQGEAYLLMGDTAAGEAAFNSVLDLWTEERATEDIDYIAHENMFPSIETRAREVTGR